MEVQRKRFPMLILLIAIMALLILPLLAYAFLAIIMVSNYSGSVFVVILSFSLGTFFARCSLERSLENTLLLFTSIIFFQLFVIELVILNFKTIEENIDTENNLVFFWKCMGKLVVNSEGAMII